MSDIINAAIVKLVAQSVKSHITEKDIDKVGTTLAPKILEAIKKQILEDISKPKSEYIRSFLWDVFQDKKVYNKFVDLFVNSIGDK